MELCESDIFVFLELGNLQIQKCYYLSGYFELMGASGRRNCWTGVLELEGSYGLYWSSSVHSADNGYDLYFNSGGNINPENNDVRSNGLSVRCVQVFAALLF